MKPQLDQSRPGPIDIVAAVKTFPTDIGWHQSPAPATTFDFDGDGAPDWWEDDNGFDAQNADDGDDDGDIDGLSNAEEYEYGTKPRVADTDGDGATDGEEQAAGTDALDINDCPPLICVDRLRGSWRWKMYLDMLE